MKKILVTGGKGMVGNALLAYVQAHPNPNHEYIFADFGDANLCDKAQTAAMFAKYQPAGVIHLAADVGGLFKNLARNVEMFENNVLMNINVMQCCKEFKVEKLVSFLSVCIFPELSTCPHLKLPLDETIIHQGPPHYSNEGYAFAKRLLDVQSRLYRRQFGCNFVTVAPTNAFGPHDNFSLQNSHVIPGLIRKCHAALEENQNFVVWGSGKPLRQFIYSPDLVKLLVWVYFNYDEPEPLILAPPAEQEKSIGEIAQSIARAFGYQKPIVFDTSYSDGQFRRTVTNQKLASRYPEFRFTPLDQALQETVEWYKQNHANARL